jgi:hypothetical protein
VPSLHSPRRKIERANEHLSVLQNEVRDWVSSQQYRVSEDSNTKPDEQTLTRRLVNPPVPPSGWGLVIGDFASNIRSALDHVAWQLALLNTQRPDKFTAFPIIKDLRDTRSAQRFDTAVQSMKQGHRDLVRGHQPSERAINPHTDLLWVLSELRNADTHRLIHTTVAQVPPLDQPTPSPPLDPKSDPLPGVAFINFTGWIDSSHEYTADSGIGIYVAFDKGPDVFANQNVLSLLTAIRNDVARITETFKTEFL